MHGDGDSDDDDDGDDDDDDGRCRSLQVFGILPTFLSRMLHLFASEWKNISHSRSFLSTVHAHTRTRTHSHSIFLSYTSTHQLEFSFSTKLLDVSPGIGSM